MALFITRQMISEECDRYTQVLRKIGYFSDLDYVEFFRDRISIDVSDPIVGNKTDTKTEWKVRSARRDPPQSADPGTPPGFWEERETFSLTPLLPVPGFLSKHRSKRANFKALVQSRRTVELLAGRGFEISATMRL